MKDDGTRWWDQANCRDTDPVVFEQPRTWRQLIVSTPRGEKRVYGHKNKDPWADARAVCAGCPVRDACLEYTLEEETFARNHGSEMFAAGLEPRQIAELRERRRRNLRRSRAVR